MPGAIKPDVREVIGILVETCDSTIDGVVCEGLGGPKRAGRGLERVDLKLKTTLFEM